MTSKTSKNGGFGDSKWTHDPKLFGFRVLLPQALDIKRCLCFPNMEPIRFMMSLVIGIFLEGFNIW
jgi:hypothetical protein